MASIQETKHRIKSIEVTRKTTKAMQLVASVKLRKSMKNLDKIQEYYNSVYDTFQDLFAETRHLSRMFPKNPKDSTLYIMITSNLGLCGAYISNLSKKLRKEYKKGDKIIVLGTKGISNLKIYNIPIFLEITNLSDTPKYANASIFGLEAISRFLNGEISKVKLIYTKFINSITFETRSLQLLPFSAESMIDMNDMSAKAVAVTQFEPSAEQVIKESIKLYISAIIYGAMVESKTSEMASRRTSMENATDNANDLIDELNIKYNRARQAAITREISEIISGSNID